MRDGREKGGAVAFQSAKLRASEKERSQSVVGGPDRKSKFGPAKASEGTSRATDSKTGAYICYTPMSFGTVYLQWSQNGAPEKTEVEGGHDLPLVYVQPGQKVADHKYKTNGGKTVLKTKCSDNKEFFPCLAGQIGRLISDNFGAKVEILDQVKEKEFQIVTHYKPGNHVKSIKELNQTQEDLSPSTISAVAVIGKEDPTLNGPTIPEALFMQDSVRCGGGVVKVRMQSAPKN